MAAPEDALPEDARRALDRIERADVVVGIPCLDNDETISGVVTAVEAGLRKHLPFLRTVIFISDGGSTDGTRETAAEAGVGERTEALLVPANVPVPEKVVFEYRGPSGKGSAIRAVLEAARRLGAAGCAVVDADLRSITPYWLDRLLTPIVHHGYGFVAPVYARHKHDGTITNSLAYPLTTALYGVRLRQPIGGEFGVAGDLVDRLLDQDVWGTDVARFGIDAFMTTTALVEGFRVGQAILGAKLHDPKDPGRDLGPMFRQVVGSLFAMAERYRDRWWGVDGVTTPPTLGFRATFSAEPVEVSVSALERRFSEAAQRHEDRWRGVLAREEMRAVERALRSDGTLGARSWIKIVYDMLTAWAAEPAARGPLLDALLPLYFARTAAFVRETLDDSPEEAEAKVEAAVDEAVELKPYLRDRWREP